MAFEIYGYESLVIQFKSPIEFQPKQNDKSVPMDDANGRQFNQQMANGISLLRIN